MRSGSVVAPVTRTGRVWGTSASSAPNVTTMSHRISEATFKTSWQNAGQPRLGSTPRSTTRSRASSGTAKNSLAGHFNPCVTPSTSSTVGRTDWKSKCSSGSIDAIFVAPKRPVSQPAA